MLGFCVSSIVVNILAEDKHRTLSIEITSITPTMKQMGVVVCVYVYVCMCVRGCV